MFPEFMYIGQKWSLISSLLSLLENIFTIIGTQSISRNPSKQLSWSPFFWIFSEQTLDDNEQRNSSKFLIKSRVLWKNKLTRIWISNFTNIQDQFFGTTINNGFEQALSETFFNHEIISQQSYSAVVDRYELVIVSDRMLLLSSKSCTMGYSRISVDTAFNRAPIHQFMCCRSRIESA